MTTPTDALIEEAIEAGRVVLEGCGNGTYAEAEDAIRKLIVATAPKPEPAPVVAGKWVMVPRKVFDFLNGTGPLEGLYFDESDRPEHTPFWWRKHLTAAPKALNGAGKPRKGGE